MCRSTTAVVLSALLAAVGAPVRAQAPADTAAVLDSVVRQISQLGARYGEAVWPGYRPDTIPFSFVLPSHGDFLFHWKGALPDGYASVPGFPEVGWRDQRALGAASTGTELAGHRVAQVVAYSLDGAKLVSTAFHEGFHVYQASVARDGKHFGAGENAFYVASYPVFDVDNEAGIALEGRILGAALDARPDSARRRLAREFVAARRARQARLGAEYAEFERAGELNEGLAQYVLVRALRLVADRGPAGWRASAREQLARQRTRLDHLTDDGGQSFRLRFYYTGPAMGVLMDQTAGKGGGREGGRSGGESAGLGWKRDLMENDRTLQDELAIVSGLDSAAMAAHARAVKAFDLAARRREAKGEVAALIAERRKQADSVLSQPGVLLVARADSLSSHDFNNCGFDPQNLLQISPSVQLQTRWWKPCGGASTMMEFNVPSVHDDSAGTVAAVIGPDSAVTITVAGKPVTLKAGDALSLAEQVKIEAPRASLSTARADLARHGDTLVVVPRP